MKKNKVTVNIMGQDYSIMTTASPLYIKKVADFVNKKIKEIQSMGFDHDNQQLRVAVLAALNITDELFTNKNKNNSNISKIEIQTQEVFDFLNQSIDIIGKK